MNFKLQGGEVIRVPEAGRVYVLGNVNRPGMFPITDGSGSSVLKVLALSGGVEHYTRAIAYVYRMQDGKEARNEIPIELKKIMDRKSPDVPLLADDILYIPEATGRKNTLTALNRIALVGVGLTADLLILYR
jgi:polysaccharide export outer membrane protein